jgi:hypothetical protein
VVPGAATVELIIPRVAAQIKELKAQRALVAASILLDAEDFSSFPTPGHLAAYAGIAPVSRRSPASGLMKSIGTPPRHAGTRHTFLPITRIHCQRLWEITLDNL